MHGFSFDVCLVLLHGVILKFEVIKGPSHLNAVKTDVCFVIVDDLSGLLAACQAGFNE